LRLTGHITNKLKPILTLSVQSAEGISEKKSFLVDTGCNLEVVLPAVEIALLRWPLVERAQITQADGRPVDVDLHEGTLLIGGFPRPVLAAALGIQPIIGMELLQGWQLCLDIIAPGEGEVRLQPL
jgi:predicted aspartyl protease